MKYSHQEGEIRPLYSSVPKNQCFWPWAVVGSYPLAYFYLRCILFGEAGRYRGWAMTAFAVVFLLVVEAAARVCRRTAARETPLWAACWLALSVTLAVPGHFYFLGLVQELAWHLLAIWCVLARCGMLAQGHTGALAPLDALAGCFTLPFGSFFARAGTVFSALRGLAVRRIGAKKWLAAMGTLVLTAVLCSFAAAQLAAADVHFAALGTWLTAMWQNFWSARLLSELFNILLSLPVGAWLFGLVYGAARRDGPPCDGPAFYKALAPYKRLPRLTCGIATGALCALYSLFFALQLAEWTAARAARPEPRPKPRPLRWTDSGSCCASNCWTLLCWRGCISSQRGRYLKRWRHCSAVSAWRLHCWPGPSWRRISGCSASRRAGSRPGGS